MSCFFSSALSRIWLIWTAVIWTTTQCVLKRSSNVLACLGGFELQRLEIRFEIC